MNTPPPIAEPCPKLWEEMKGDAKRRFCEHCQHHVHNLSEMTTAEREEILASKGRVCIAYEVNAKGVMVTRDDQQGFFAFFTRFRWAFLALVASILPFGFSSCTTRRTLGVPQCPSPPPNDHQEQKYDSRGMTVGLFGPQHKAPKESHLGGYLPPNDTNQ